MSDIDQRVSDSFGEDTLPIAPNKWLAGVQLPPELLTGHKAIDFEHSQLVACVRCLRSLCHKFDQKAECSSCSVDTHQVCETQLIALLGDLLAFILDHFKNEEKVMRSSLLLTVDRELCLEHIEDHANISAKVQEIILALQPLKTASLLRELDALLQRWISNHVLLHDILLGRWLESRGEELNFD